MNKRINQIILLLKADMRLLLSISFGIFLFILFFQPFHINRFDFNNSLLFVAGFGAIVFLIMAAARISFHWLINHLDNLLPSYLKSFVIWSISTLAFTFYLRYVGSITITLFIVFKIALICMVPPIILRVRSYFTDLQQENASLKEKLSTTDKVPQTTSASPVSSIEFMSENNSERITLLISNVALIKAANNYVEVVYQKDNVYKKKLLRNTLKNIEEQLIQFPEFMRIHRMCIVNTHFVESLQNNANKQWLNVTGLGEEIPVSRQYLVKLKEAL